MKKTILILCSALIVSRFALAQTEKPQFYDGQAKVDLDGDGTADLVSLEVPENSTGDFLLKINDKSVKGRLSDTPTGFFITDIDSSDRLTEVLVYTPGPSDDDEYLVYQYDGKKIWELGHLSRWPLFLGNGIVYVKDWMGFWEKVEKFVLNKKERRLQRIPQELYYVGVKTTVSQSFPIYQRPKSPVVIANLKVGSSIEVLAWLPQFEKDDYSEQWYLIRTEHGLLGYAPLKGIKVTNLPWAD